MAIERKYIRKVKGSDGIHHAFWCPGCKCAHLYGPTWRFNGDFAKPTFTPSLHVFVRERTDAYGRKVPRQTLCHLFVTNGQIKFLGDCAHELKGQTVPLSEFPENYDLREWVE